MKSTILVLAVMLVVGSVKAEPVQWSPESGGNGHFYEVVTFTTTFLSWGESLDDAESRVWLEASGYLATITSAAENEWVWENMGNPHAYFLGAFQPSGSAEPDGGWQWVTGETWEYTNWAFGEPNNAASGPTGVEDCLQFTGSSVVQGQWNDADVGNIPIGGASGYVVEYAPAVVSRESSSWGKLKALYR